ncbi:ATP-dependent DNA helicase pif1 [Plakobranchus ocellatus]|uniref:ATP-dependent DNA helicase n=1 Tax=Plakobranchus ocellatus TaxID=259542 RepID=A0AAV4B6W6_9GAST|nr:ATP-dependent DNA helicase pif1 [Plakobranchus ocellatus]
MCSIKKGTALARLIQNAAVLIIYEAQMLHTNVIEALDRIFLDIRSSEAVCGGLLTLMCGDFRQILSVFPQGTRANIVNAGLKKSQLWEQVRTRNMHVLTYGGNSTFPDLLLKIGNGQLQSMTSDPDVIS